MKHLKPFAAIQSEGVRKILKQVCADHMRLPDELYEEVPFFLETVYGRKTRVRSWVEEQIRRYL